MGSIFYVKGDEMSKKFKLGDVVVGYGFLFDDELNNVKGKIVGIAQAVPGLTKWFYFVEWENGMQSAAFPENLKKWEH